MSAIHQRQAQKQKYLSVAICGLVILTSIASCGRSKNNAQKEPPKPTPIVSASPQFTPPPGIYDAVDTVTLSTPGSVAKIFYTTDGSEPVVDHSPLYAGPIKVTDNQIVRAVAKMEKLPVSDVVGGGYSTAGKGALDVALYGRVGADVTSGTADEIADGVFGNPGNGWVAGGVGSWVSVAFDAPVALSRILIADSAGLDGHVELARLLFSDGSEIAVDALSDNGAPSVIEFPTKTVSSFKLEIQRATGVNFGIAELAAYGPVAEQKIIAEEHFSNYRWGWNLAAKPGDTPLDWERIDKREDKSVFNEATHDGFEVGMYGVWSGPIASAGMDLRVRGRDDNMNVFATLGTGMIGVIFGYQDDNNFYRYSASMHRGFRKLEKRANGVFTELARSSRSFSGGQWVNLRIVAKGGKIIALQDGKVALAADDPSFSGGKVGVWSGWSESATFDNVTLLAAPTEPVIALLTPVEYSVTTKLDVTARAIVTSPVAAVEFVVDEGQLSEQRARVGAAPYENSFHFSSPGDHMVAAYIVDGAGALVPSGAAKSAKVGVGAVSIMTFGDSITDRVGDDWPLDDISRDGRSTGGGYESVLSDLLAAHIKSRPVGIANEGYAGEMTIPAVEKIGAVLKHHPEASVVLLQMGSNDSSGDNALGDEEFAKRVKQMIESVLAVGKQVYVALPPPRLRHDKQNELLRKYNKRIEALVSSYESSHPGRVHVGPDFYRYFDAHQNEFFADGIHPNGFGLRSMARLWFDVLKDKVN